MAGDPRAAAAPGLAPQNVKAPGGDPGIGAATSIASGTDEIQRNIISERVLDMPRERTGDADKPFKDVPPQARENKADDNMARFTVRWLGHAAGLLLMLLATACATPPAPQVATPPPPGQARIWFYRLWDPSESLNSANIDVNGVYFGSVEPGSAFYRDVAPGVYQIAPQNKYLDYNQNTNVAVVPGQQVFIAVLDLSSWANAVSGAQRSVHRDSWYARLVPPQYALAEITSPALVPRPNALPAAPLVY